MSQHQLKASVLFSDGIPEFYALKFCRFQIALLSCLFRREPTELQVDQISETISQGAVQGGPSRGGRPGGPSRGGFQGGFQRGPPGAVQAQISCWRLWAQARPGRVKGECLSGMSAGTGYSGWQLDFRWHWLEWISLVYW